MPRTSRAARPDENKDLIVRALRACDVSVVDLAGGGGVPDLACGHDGQTFLLEVKSGANGLNRAQEKFHDAWRGHAAIVRTVGDALKELSASRSNEIETDNPELLAFLLTTGSDTRLGRPYRAIVGHG